MWRIKTNMKIIGFLSIAGNPSKSTNQEIFIGKTIGVFMRFTNVCQPEISLFSLIMAQRGPEGAIIDWAESVEY